MNRSIILLAGAGLLSACAAPATAATGGTAAYRPALLVVEEESRPARPESASVPALALASQPAARSGLARVGRANRSAIREPGKEDYVGAVQVYPWTEGAVYRLYAAPGRVSDIALQPGEALVSVAAGDTVRWVIGDTSSGAGAARRTHVLVKPSASGLATNLVIATDRRVYQVEALSNARTAMPGIAWSYPADGLIALAGVAAADPVAGPVALDALNFDYRISGANAPWRPIRAFDDGRQVFIEFPPTLAQGEAPPLFVTGGTGRAELVNYRIRGHYYVVDRLFEAAELRLGEKHQSIVRIRRGSDAQRRGDAR